MKYTKTVQTESVWLHASILKSGHKIQLRLNTPMVSIAAVISS